MKASFANSLQRVSMTNNPLDQVLAWYQTTLDSLRVTERAIKQSIPRAVTTRHSSFHGNRIEVNIAKLEDSKAELGRVVVLALTAIFERTLRDYVGGLSVVANATSDPIHDRVRSWILEDSERWNFRGRLVDLFVTVDEALQSQVKQIIDYRNWVAHGHAFRRSPTSSVTPPPNITPPQAHQRLTEFLTQAGILT